MTKVGYSANPAYTRIQGSKYTCFQVDVIVKQP